MHYYDTQEKGAVVVGTVSCRISMYTHSLNERPPSPRSGGLADVQLVTRSKAFEATIIQARRAPPATCGQGVILRKRTALRKYDKGPGPGAGGRTTSPGQAPRTAEPSAPEGRAEGDRAQRRRQRRRRRNGATARQATTAAAGRRQAAEATRRRRQSTEARTTAAAEAAGTHQHWR